MRQLAGIVVIAMFAVCAYAGGLQDPQIRMADNKLSIKAEAVPLRDLLRLVDDATGMTSKVPDELANRNISVQFSDLGLNAAVRKIFEGQRLDYFFIGGRGIIVTAASQLSSGPMTEPGVPPPSYMNDQPFNPVENNETFIPPQPPMPQPGFNTGFNSGPFQQAAPANPFNQQQPQPAMIQTPFGPIPNPRANPGGQQPTGTAPMVVPGQQYPFGTPQPFGSPNPFGASPGMANPGLGAPAPPLGGNNLGLSPSSLQNQPR
jgi:hypothetical protein